MVIEVYSIDEAPKFKLFRFESDCIPRENEIILYLTNNMDSLYYYNSAGMLIENCVQNENITINGLMNEIATNDVSHSSTLMDDYNWNPLHLINLDDSVGNYHNDNLFTDNRINIIQNQGVACNLSFAYRTIRSGVI